MHRWPYVTPEVAQRDQNYFGVSPTGALTSTSGGQAAKSFQYQSDTSSCVPSNVFNELQHEVSSLLEFKNALLETFPHLQGKLGHSHSQPKLHQSYGTSPPSSTGRANSSTTLREHDSSDIRSPTSPRDRLSAAQGAVSGASGQSGRQIQHVHDSDEIPGSWNGSSGTATLPRTGHKGQKVRKSPEGSSNGSNIVDSGFSTETTKDISSSGTSTLMASNSSGRGMMSHPNYALDVRWDTWEQGPPHSTNPAEDELYFLLDVIHRKSVRLRKDFEHKTIELSLAQNPVPPENLPHHDASTRSTTRRLQPQIPLVAGAQSGNVNAKGLRAISEHDASEANHPHQQSVIHSGTEVDVLRRERELLIRRVAHLESENAEFNVRMGNNPLDQSGEIFHMARLKGTSGRSGSHLSEQKATAGLDGSELVGPDGGIVHSVQIRTGGVGELRRAMSTSSESSVPGNDQHGVNIEIKQQRHARHSIGRAPAAGLLGVGGISVVNLRGSVDNLLPHGSNPPNNPSARSYSFNEVSGPGRHRTNSFGAQQKLAAAHRPKMIPSRIVVPPGGAQAKMSPQLNRVLSNKNLNPKSKSVENLVDGAPILGLKSANSEMNMFRQSQAQIAEGRHAKFSSSSNGRSHRLRGTTSELNVARIGCKDKLKLGNMEGILSMPVELTKGLGLQIKPNREKIRQVLNMNNVIELQRQLLTTVMENEVYKTQLERLSDNWSDRIGEFERANGSLHDEVDHLREENDELKIKVNKKLIELESAKAKLKVMEKNQFPVSEASGRPVRNLPVAGSHLTKAPSENRVHFDLHTTPTPSATLASKSNPSDVKRVSTNTTVGEGLRPPVAQGPLGSSTGRRGIHHSQLPSDTRQRLEEMANSASKKYVTTRGQTDAVQELIATRFHFPPTNAQSAGLPALGAKPAVTRRETAVSPGVNNNRERSLNVKNCENGSGLAQPPIALAAPASPVPVGGVVAHQSITNNNNHINNLQSSHSSSSHLSISNNDPSKKTDSSPSPILSEKDLKAMGRDTIAGLIAGILQKYSHKKEDEVPNVPHELPSEPPRKEVPSESPAPVGASRTSLLSTPTGGNSSMRRVSWEANNCLEEVTQSLQQRHAATPLRMMESRQTPSPRSHSKTRGDFESLQYSPNDFQDSLHQESHSGDHLHDSLQFPPHQAVQPDSLSFDEDTFNQRERNSMEFFDSISSTERKQSDAAKNKKLIIPYTDSYSSNTSLFTSQEESIDSGEGRKEDEEESTSFPKDMIELAKKINQAEKGPRRLHLATSAPLTNKNEFYHHHHNHATAGLKRAVSASPLQVTDNGSFRPANGRLLPTPNIYLRNHHGSNPDLRRHSPMISEHRNANTPSPSHQRSVSQMNQLMTLKFPTSYAKNDGPMRGIPDATGILGHPSHTGEDLGSSRVRLATDIMKRKFLGWN